MLKAYSGNISGMQAVPFSNFFQPIMDSYETCTFSFFEKLCKQGAICLAFCSSILSALFVRINIMLSCSVHNSFNHSIVKQFFNQHQYLAFLYFKHYGRTLAFFCDPDMRFAIIECPGCTARIKRSNNDSSALWEEVDKA